jgi:hypothetical protein
MLRIRVDDFSCITQADFVFGRINVLIGPQASGKSVLSKLAYFFLELLTDLYEPALEQKSFDHFTDQIKTRFSEWFPVPAWGKKKFKIQFEVGDFKMKLTRTSYDESIKDKLRIWASPFAKEHYKRTVDLAKTFRQKNAKRAQAPYAGFELSYEVQVAATKLLQSSLGEDFVYYQTFIPAGRSFFTTLGRAFMAFDQGRALDPITVRFGRMYSAFYDESRFFSPGQRTVKVDAELAEILGGSIKWEGDRPFLLSTDGRTVPFSALSSGQQELLPLVIAIASLRRMPSTRTDPRPHLLYIEEPEAHLFPSAQSRLIQGLAALVSGSSRRLAITTHSPYVLATINNLIKAGSLELSLPPEKQGQLDGLVPKNFRIKPGATAAYAIIDGVLKSILDSDGLIDADYLDSISGEIGKQFSALLGLEFTE